MAEWKKIIVSGSDISQLNNDAGYLASTGTIDSASVAARATTLSPDATASFADLASDARTADSASVAARATLLSSDATASFADLASDARTADSASVAARATTLSPEATASIADRATTASFAETGDGIFSGSFSGSFEGDGSGLTGLATNLTVDGNTGTEDVDLLADDLQILGTSEEIETAVTKVGNDVRVTLGLPDSITVTASLASNAESASVAARATTLSADATASFADLASDARTADSASVAARATTLSPDATASFADLASDARTATSASQASNASSASVAARATTLSADATASFADLASTVHDGNITAAKIATDAVTTDKILNGNVTNAKLANDSVTIGTTEIDLGTTAASLTGLTSISATTGSFVLQVFESSSTIITSGSNIFGDAQNDIQQFTGSILQTGSMTTTGTITADEVSSDKFSGSFSGSFQGDGSGLTGLATTLTVDGDTGTEDADLIQDDLQILGTSEEITTAVTKVGNDVKVTIGLPDSITVTASLATNAESASEASHASTASVADRATTLSADATASFADLASDARTADSASVAARATTLSPEATASIADTATTASHAITAVSASATIAGDLFPTTAGLEGQTIVLNNSGEFVYGDAFGTGSTQKLNQSVAASTWSFQHNLDEVYPIVQVYDSNGDQLIAERIESIDANNIKLYFAEDTAGVAAAMVGGMGISASFATEASTARSADSASVAARATELSADATASFADLASDARTADSASVAARATELSADATASFADRATSASIADELSQLATASQADSATTASHALGGAGDFSGSFIGDGSGLTGVAGDFNFDGDTGATTINLLTETASFNGTAGEIETTVTANTLTIGLPDNVTIGNNLTVTNDATIAGDLVVGGSIVSASSLEVADQFIILASGSNGAIDGGIIVNQVNDDPDGRGVAFAYDSSADRWALQSELVDTATTITPDAYVGVIQESAGVPSSDPVYGGTSGKGTIFVDTSNNEAYIYV